MLVPPEDAYLTEQGLDAWARDTNGAPFDEETKEELLEFLDVNDDGSLTYGPSYLICMDRCVPGD